MRLFAASPESVFFRLWLGEKWQEIFHRVPRAAGAWSQAVHFKDYLSNDPGTCCKQQKAHWEQVPSCAAPFQLRGLTDSTVFTQSWLETRFYFHPLNCDSLMQLVRCKWILKCWLTHRCECPLAVVLAVTTAASEFTVFLFAYQHD